jgi:hypothetical protein
MQAGAAAAATPADTVARVLELARAAEHAQGRVRLLRAHELFARALAAADAVLPRDSLVAATLLYSMINTHVIWRAGIGEERTASVMRMAAAWRDDVGTLLPWAQRGMNVLHARWRAGTLFTLTPEERAYCAGMGVPPLRAAGGEAYIAFAHEALTVWPPALRSAAEQEARLRGVHGALRAALELHARGYLRPGALQDAMHLQDEFPRAVAEMVSFALSDLRRVQQLRAVCGLTRAEEAALRALGPPLLSPSAILGRLQRAAAVDDSARKLRDGAAADVARHGLRACALPDCAAAEPHPKAFKLCARCRTAAYCCAAHQQQDWRCHKRDDGCRTADATAS